MDHFCSTSPVVDEVGFLGVDLIRSVWRGEKGTPLHTQKVTEGVSSTNRNLGHCVSPRHCNSEVYLVGGTAAEVWLLVALGRGFSDAYWV